MPIGEIRGEVPAGGDATKFRPRLNQEIVVVRGVVHQIFRWRTGKGDDVYGMMIQNVPSDADGNPKTSDGLFVYVGRTPVLPLEAQGDYAVSAGDVVTLRGKVNFRYGQVELSDVQVLNVKSGGKVDELISPVELKLPESFSERQRVLEQSEGMRVRLSAGAVAVSGTHPQFRTHDTQLWVIPSDNPAAIRENKASRRQYRPYHPLSVVSKDLKQDGNGNFLILGSLGLVERLEDRDAALTPSYAGTVVESEVTGGIQYGWGEYVLQPDHIPEFSERPEGLPTVSTTGSDERHLRIAAYNVENLYDFVNDPFDDCDFHDDEGCPGSRFPLNYVPASEEVFRARIKKIAQQIVNDLHSPHILMIQEAEDQDIAKLQNGSLVYGDENNADGQTDGLQELALQIVAEGGPVYTVMVDRDGTDDRGIICAWMVQEEKLQAVAPQSMPSIFGESPSLPNTREWLSLCEEVSNPKAFNAAFEGSPDNASELVPVFSRSMQVLLLEDKENGKRIWLQNNHFSSGPSRRVDRRREQAAVNADVAQAILKIDPAALLIVGGDLNVFPRPDDPLDPPSDQLGPLYDAGLFNVVERIMAEDPAKAYSYIYKGVVSILDHFFLSPTARDHLRFAAYLKLNAGTPETFPEFPPLRASDHDPLLIELAW